MIDSGRKCTIPKIEMLDIRIEKEWLRSAMLQYLSTYTNRTIWLTDCDSESDDAWEVETYVTEWNLVDMTGIVRLSHIADDCRSLIGKYRDELALINSKKPLPDMINGMFYFPKSAWKEIRSFLWGEGGE